MTGTRLWLLIGSLAALLAVCGAALVVAFDTGRKVERGQWVADQNAVIKKAGTDYDDRLRLANRSATAAIADAREARDFSTALQQEIRHVPVPLVTSLQNASCRPDRDAQPADALAVVAQPTAVAAGLASPEPSAAPPDAPQGLDDRGDLWLTFSAVRLWNSALAGEQLPAGACRADDPTSAACAARSRTTLEDAFGDHTENATRCRQDRGQLNRLIDVIEQRSARATPEPTP